VFKLYGGKGWKRAMLMQLVGLPMVAVVLFMISDITAILYESSMAMPLRNIAGVFALFILVCLPLQIVGTIIGRGRASRFSFPCRVRHLRRPIPTKSPAFLPLTVLLGGVIPFGCVFIELYFLFSSFWSHKFYYVYGFMILVLVIFCCVLVCVSITSVYVILNSEDYRWAWVSFLSCSSTAFYAFVYAIYYFWRSTRMTGLLQFVYYINATLFFCICLGLFCGALGYTGASRFVRLIYRNVKCD